MKTVPTNPHLDRRTDVLRRVAQRLPWLVMAWLCQLPLLAQNPPALTPVIAENAGGPAVGAFRKDTSFGTIESGDLGQTFSTTDTVSVAGVRNAAPAAVYQSERWGRSFTYTLAGTADVNGTPRLTPGVTYLVRLHFAEIYFTHAGQRRFNLAINGQQVLTDFDIVAEAGGPKKALVREFIATARPTRGGNIGNITLNFTQGAADNPKVSGLEILPATLFERQQPALRDFADNRSYELGTRFTASTSGEIRAIRYWKAASDPGPHVGRIWSSAGAQLTEATFTEPTASPNLPSTSSGWQEMALSTPLRIVAGATYTVSVNANSHYVATVGGLEPPVSNGYLSTQGAGTYGDSGTFPTSTYQNSNYFRDVVFVASPAPPTPPVVTPALLAVNAGGGAQGAFAADNAFFGFNNNAPGRVVSTTAPVSVAGVPNAAPAAVYQTQREGDRFGYRLGGVNADNTPRLRTGTRYLVRLHFAEIRYTQPGQRRFNVFVGAGAVATQVLSNFDIVAEAGGPHKAVVREFVTTPRSLSDGTNVIELQFASRPGATDSADVATISGIEVLPATNVPLAAINSGGGAVGRFRADGQTGSLNGGGNVGLTATTTAAIDTAGVRNAAPPAVYQSERYGTADATGILRFQYTLTGTEIGGTPIYTPGASYLVRLHFAEIQFTQPGQRRFNVVINGQPALTDFDIVAEAGAPNKALVKEFVTTARTIGNAGFISLDFVQGSSADVPTVSGIEVVPAPAAGARPAAATAAATVNRAGKQLDVAVYPNPVSDRLTVHTNGLLEDTTLFLTDGQGRTVRQVRVTKTNSAANLDLRGVTNGLYYLLVPGAPAQKVVVQH